SPGDDDAPCKPGPPVLVEAPECGCQTNDFTNRLSWTQSDEDCNRDIDYYNIYYANTPNGDYVLLATGVRGLEYDDRGLGRTSFAACYKIASVDRSGNVSELSDPMCVENCPYYELPNFFTPNGDGCNDVFSAYSDR